MEALIGIGAVLAVAAITPGPNNLVVIRAAANSGVRGALPAIAGIVLGSLALLALTVAGAGAAIGAEPRLQTLLTLGGCLYLAWLGARSVLRSLVPSGRDSVDDARQLPVSVPGLFAFQFLNPKAWVLVLTVASAAHGDSGSFATYSRLAGLFLVVPTVCLLVWAAFGAAMSRVLVRPAPRRWFDFAMGSLLLGSALLVLVEQ